MKILALAIFNDKHKMEKFCADLSQFYFFQRNTIKEYCIFGMKTLIERMEENSVKISMNGEKDFKVSAVFHILRIRNGFASAITDTEYPTRVIFSLLDKIDGQSLEECLQTYQNPKKVDKLTKVQSELDEIKVIMIDNIDQVLKRGENLDELIAKSEDLSKEAKIFQKRAKKLNACCKSW